MLDQMERYVWLGYIGMYLPGVVRHSTCGIKWGVCLTWVNWHVLAWCSQTLYTAGSNGGYIWLGYVGMYLPGVVRHCTCGVKWGLCLSSYPCKTALYLLTVWALEQLAIYVDYSVLLSLWLLFHIVFVVFDL